MTDFMIKPDFLIFQSIVLGNNFHITILLLAENKEEVSNISTYKVKEYYSYNEYSFYDLENVIDATGKRQIQPNPTEKYAHTDPWTTQDMVTVGATLENTVVSS